MRARSISAWLLLVLASLFVATAAHSDTTQYSYDPLGRLTQVSTTAGTGTTTSYTYDPADNRSNVTVTTAPATCSGVSFGIASNAAVSEGANSVFTVTKTGAATANCSVSYATLAGTATSGADYVAASGTLIFTPAQTSQTVSVSTVDDAVTESAEAFTMALSSPSGGATLGAQYSVAATINDNEVPATCSGVSFTISAPAPLMEGGSAVFTVTKTGTATISCSVNYATANGLGFTTPADYVAASGTLTFTSTQTSRTFSVQTIDDSDIEATESFTASLSNPANGATLGSPSSAVAHVTDTDTAPTCAGVNFTISSNGPVTEGATAVITVTKNGTASGSCILNYKTVDGSATRDDYSGATGSFSFTQTQTTATFSVPTTNDTFPEAAESFTAVLTFPWYSAILGNPSSVAVVINDNDGGGGTSCSGVSFTIAPAAAVTEGGSSVFTVTKTGSTTASCSVNYTTTDGTADLGDFHHTTGTVTFTAAETSKTFSISTWDDTLAESAETFSAVLSSPSSGATIGSPGSASGTINDNDSTPVCSGVSFAIGSPPAVTEGGTTVFTVTKAGTATGSCGVNYATANGTAAAGSDYTAATGTLTFLTGDTSKTFSVVTTDDASVESAETYSASLSGPSGGATLGSPTSATATINDNDSAPVCSGVSFAIGTPAAVTEGGTTVFTVTKSGSATGSCGVNYATANGTAAAGSDYTASSGTLTFTTVQTSRTFSVATTDDAVVESAETYTSSLSSPSGGATLGSPTSATATINDNDSGGSGCSGVSFRVSDYADDEGNPIVFTVTKTGTATGSCSVSYATANGSAITPNDYAAASGTLTFAAGETSKTVSVSTVVAGPGEGTETMYLNLSGATGGSTISDSQGVGTIYNYFDDGGGGCDPVCP